MADLKKVIKKEIAKEAGKQVSNIIKRNIKNCDPKALDAAKKLVEQKALKIMDGKSASSSSKTTGTSNRTSGGKTSKFTFSVGGLNKVVKDGIKGKNIGKSVKDNTSFTVKYEYKF